MQRKNRAEVCIKRWCLEYPLLLCPYDIYRWWNWSSR